MTQPMSHSELSALEQGTHTRSLLNIWVFNGNITFSSTEEPKSPLSAVKVLYRLVGEEEANKMLESMTSDVQDIALPADGIDTVTGILGKSNNLLPESDRHFREWTVGLLEKWVAHR
ncbi:hypothetical protein DL766_004789 [Monosporascus sp. MC13-8B]|uniref:Uncharacterized protein n=1 Tax=Monosporascus cannonballus TaxID=155416 RepID=A0ABY0H406_9PEZI|nr:hypothetical protein DL762_007312 [Monosporascus cannonballus]RYO93472.1 hypothetical protein DL763_004375 [Monosporascus cannonballus]RYP30607.1 hypothetical protein DL766_004789 [Monosporascus sp. MC13-8B]